MLKIGLTGSIGMGKSTTSNMFKQKGVPIFDADAIVHILYQKDYQGYDAIKIICPDAAQGPQVDRAILSKHIIKHPKDLKKIEVIIHPLVREIQKEFFNQTKQTGAKFIIFDIPLLFEMKINNDMDKVIVVTCSADIQKERVMQRADMSEEKFSFILSKQMDDAQKREKADYIINTNNGLEDAKKQVDILVKKLNNL